jgi:hypothetical protein
MDFAATVQFYVSVNYAPNSGKSFVLYSLQVCSVISFFFGLSYFTHGQ